LGAKNNIYRIRCKATGKYSMGGSPPVFTKEGKYYKRLSDLRKHFALLKLRNPNEYEMWKARWMVEEYELHKVVLIDGADFDDVEKP